MSVKSICGVILVSRAPEALARFYAEALELALKREEHGDLAPHWGVDIGAVHFGIHPPANFRAAEACKGGSVAVTFDVASVADCQARLTRLGATCLAPPHEEGFGTVALFSDPEGNLFEIVELTYEFT